MNRYSRQHEGDGYAVEGSGYAIEGWDGIFWSKK